MKLDSILLDGMLPRVFVSEKIPDSQIWLSHTEFRRGEFYLVEAASGGGKSSMCSFIFGARTDFEGSLLFNGVDTARFDMARWQEIRRANIAYLPQDLMLFPELSAIENIRLKNDLTGHASEKMIDHWMERLGIDSRRDYPVGKMSVGQQQRVALVRSLCQPFDFILLDEPVSHLDETNNRIAADLIAEEAAGKEPA